MKTKKVKELPKCSFCDASAFYDVPTHRGSWAYVCEPHCIEYASAPQIGTKFELDTSDGPEPEYDRVLEAKFIDDLGDGLEVLEASIMDGIVECADGCEVEPDGKCPHGYSSPLLLLGLI